MLFDRIHLSLLRFTIVGYFGIFLGGFFVNKFFFFEKLMFPRASSSLLQRIHSSFPPSISSFIRLAAYLFVSFFSASIRESARARPVRSFPPFSPFSCVFFLVWPHSLFLLLSPLLCPIPPFLVPSSLPLHPALTCTPPMDISTAFLLSTFLLFALISHTCVHSTTCRLSNPRCDFTVRRRSSPRVCTTTNHPVSIGS